MKEFRELEDFVGTHFIYTHDNGWGYEWYAKNDHTVGYRIHDEMVEGHWVKDQEADIVKSTDGVFKIIRTELVGTDMALDFMSNEKELHGVVFFPKWVEEHPGIIVTLQDEHIAKMGAAHEKYETYPKLFVPEFAIVAYMDNADTDNEDVISEELYGGMLDGIRSGKYLDENYRRVR